nr:MFS transporter [Amycolatopsis anabasis]
MLLLAVDLTVLHLAMPKLVEDIRPSTEQFLWIADVYGFALAGFLVTMGGVGDRIGRRKLLLIGSGVFGAASVLTAFAPNAEALIGARALLGIAGATVMPSTLSLIRNVFTDPKERTAAIGLWSGIGIVGFGAGPLVGGALLTHFWWGSVFLLNVPVVVVIIALGSALVPESRDPAPGRLDPASVLLSVVGVIAIVYAVKEIAHQGFGHADVLIAVVLGIGGLAAFTSRQLRLPEPLIDVRLFRQRAFAATVGSTLIAVFAMLAMSLVVAQYLQLVAGWSPLRAGLAGLPGPAAAIAGALLTAPLIARFGRAGTIAAGMGLSALGFLLYARIGTEVDYPFLVVAMVVFGAGLSMTLTVSTDTVLATVPKERAGAASAISETANELGGALGIAVLGSVLGAVYRDKLVLPPDLPEAAAGPIRESLGTAVGMAAELPPALGVRVVDSARAAFLDAAHLTMYGSAALLAGLGVSVLFTLRGVPKVIDEVSASAPPAEPRTGPRS